MLDKYWSYPVTPTMGVSAQSFETFGITPESDTLVYKEDDGTQIQQDRVAAVYGIRGNVAVQIGTVARRCKVVEDIDAATQTRKGYKVAGPSGYHAILLNYGQKGHKQSHFQPINAQGRVEIEELKKAMLLAASAWAKDTGSLDKADTVRAAASGPVIPADVFGK